MENIIKQGYLKKGNSVEGGMFSSLLERITPRRWFMLVVRRRVPYLEQYDRDVDVFSGAVLAVHNLSVVNSISYPMAVSTKSFTFYIVCPDQLIELIATSREQMLDWCSALERTLSSLGVLQSDREEHVYTFCPAVSNLLGRSQGSREEEEEEEEEGAVGGIPAPPPPRPQPPRQSLVRRTASEPAGPLNNLSPPPPPLPTSPPLSALRAKTGLSQSDGNPTSPLSLSAAPNIPPDPPPPLPPGRPNTSGLRVDDRPPRPPPPGRSPPSPSSPASSQQAKSLPPVPTQPAHPHSADISNDSDTDDTSSDFVSIEFWEINRKKPLPTSRVGVLPERATSSPPGGRAGVGDSDHSAQIPDTSAAAPDENNTDDLDEGYSDLAQVESLKGLCTMDGSTKGRKDEYASIVKNGACASEANWRDSGEERWKAAGGTDQLGASRRVDVPQVSEACDNGMRGADSGESGRPAQAGLQHEAKHPPPENLYAPFPTERAGACADDGELDEVYACAADASSLPPTSLPPLPRRQDSLPSWKGDDSQETDSAVTAAPDSCSSSVAATPSGGIQKAAVSKPVPALRKTLQPNSSHPDKSSMGGESTPPLPPRRDVSSLSKSAANPPPPLPSRRTHSVYAKRTVTSDPGVIGHESPASCEGAGGDYLLKNHAALIQRQHAKESKKNSNDVDRKKCVPFSGGDGSASENHLRQRMRLDREHSGHSVISLKRSQTDILRQEMELPGVTVTLTTRAAQGIALVDCEETVCIVGWNQGNFPSLHSKFHIGDQVISVSNVKAVSTSMAQRLLRQGGKDMVEMLVRRIPHAAVVAIRRHAQGQSIGIKRVGGTAEIEYVDPNGLAALNGLPQHAPAVLKGQTRSHWVLTEINSRHLSLFFKNDEIEHRLNAVGREITLVAQPSDYIGELKRQMKKLKNYKNYIVQ